MSSVLERKLLSHQRNYFSPRAIARHIFKIGHFNSRLKKVWKESIAFMYSRSSNQTTFGFELLKQFWSKDKIQINPKILRKLTSLGSWICKHWLVQNEIYMNCNWFFIVLSLIESLRNDRLYLLKQSRLNPFYYKWNKLIIYYGNL